MAGLMKAGRCFICSECPEAVQNLRCCHTDRWDYTQDDATFWPIYLTTGGNAYGFCPSKATTDIEAVSLYRLLTITAETGQLIKSGAILDQPQWYIDLLSWFLPRYNDLRFYSRARAILGDGKK